MNWYATGGIMLALLSTGTATRASQFVVTNLNDAGAGSLRQAVIDANTQGGADDVVFAPGLTGTITLLTSQLQISDELTIRGPGADQMELNGNGVRRIFNITAGPVVIEDLTLRNARALDAGGAVFVTSSALTMRRCAVEDCFVTASPAYGGAIATTGGAALVLDACLFARNSAGGGTQAFGGAIRQASGTFSATNCTFSSNIAAGSSDSFGGGLSIGGSSQSLVHCTLTENDVISGFGRGAGLYFAGSGTFTLRSVLNADNVGATDFGRSTGTYVSLGYNLDGDGGSLLPGGGTDLVGSDAAPIDPLLGPLLDNGGPTWTRDLLPGSPALDAGGDGAGLDSDQRGFPRVSDADCAGIVAADIGAYELTLPHCGCPFDVSDANCDGSINFFDIDPFVLALFDLPAYHGQFCNGLACAVDTDCSGNIDFFDIDPFVACLFGACDACP